MAGHALQRLPLLAFARLGTQLRHQLVCLAGVLGLAFKRERDTRGHGEAKRLGDGLQDQFTGEKNEASSITALGEL